tara:strand:+ start:144 stop:449 length:306 start_codon:yes stop_codon:yes gene_type:complete
MDNKSFYLSLLAMVVVLYLLIGIQEAKGEDKVKTTCRLASQILVNKQRVCVFVGANNTQYREYVPYDAGECPRQYQCPYRPNEKPFDLKSVIKSIKDQFKK